MDEDETDVSTHPLDQTILQRFAHWRYDALFVDWEKTKIRLDADRDGAVTAARALIETTAKVTLDEMGVPYQEAWDLPKPVCASFAFLKISVAPQHACHS